MKPMAMGTRTRMKGEMLLAAAKAAFRYTPVETLWSLVSLVAYRTWDAIPFSAFMLLTAAAALPVGLFLNMGWDSVIDRHVSHNNVTEFSNHSVILISVDRPDDGLAPGECSERPASGIADLVDAPCRSAVLRQ